MLHFIQKYIRENLKLYLRKKGVKIIMNRGKALITGASSGIGREFAYKLSGLGYDLILTARRRERLEETATACKTSCKIIEADLSEEAEAFRLYEELKGEDLSIVINNAGFGLFGEFSKTELSRELNMIELNIKSVHILTKLFLKDFKKRNSGYILNVSSSASFLPGPLMSTYYATKAYVQRLTLAISEELRREKSNVYIGAFCPGPVDTEFNSVADVKFNLKGISSRFAAEYGIENMFKRKILIIPGATIKLGTFFQKFIPVKTLLKISYNIQKRKDD